MRHCNRVVRICILVLTCGLLWFYWGRETLDRDGCIEYFALADETDGVHGLGRPARLAERFRMFNKCFLESRGLCRGLRRGPVLPSRELEFAMLPFLSRDAQEDSVPSVLDLRTGREVDVQRGPKGGTLIEALTGARTARRGIALTMPDDPKGLIRLLRVLDVLGNDLDVQVVQAQGSSSLSEQSQALVRQFLQDSRQNVYLVDCSALLDARYAREHIVSYANKWIASLFNTFEEAILLDLDTVPFVGPASFFANALYRESGLLMFRDRPLRWATAAETCLQAFQQALQQPLPDTQVERNVAARFFQQGLTHHVDSGLVVFHKRRKLGSLLLALALNTDPQCRSCLHGDKEYFWLAPLLVGQPYRIDPADVGALGALRDTTKPPQAHELSVCAAHIAHQDHNGKLLWLNGGLTVCKFDDSADRDFAADPTFFQDRYGSTEALRTFYNSPIPLQALVVPDMYTGKWLPVRECSMFMYCAYVETTEVTSGTSVTRGTGTVTRYSSEYQQELSRIVDAWTGRIND